MKTIQSGILHFLADHMDFNRSLYHLFLNVFKVSDLPPGPVRESVPGAMGCQPEIRAKSFKSRSPLCIREKEPLGSRKRFETTSIAVL